MRLAPGQRMLFDERICCLGCGRILSGAKSIERRYGPTCLKRLRKKKRRRRKKRKKER